MVAIAAVSGSIWTGSKATGRNQRTVIISVVPFFAGSLKLLKRMSTPIMCVIAVWAAFQYTDLLTPLPAPSATAQEYGEYAFCLAFLCFAAVYVPRAYGVSILARLDQVNGIERNAVLAMRFFGAIFIGWLISLYRGPYCWFAVLLILIYAGGITFATLQTAALDRFAKAPVVVPLAAGVDGSLLFVQISDVHVTCQKDGIPTGGGRSGLDKLRKIDDAIKERLLCVDLIVVCGDLVDRGDEEEWALALPPLRGMRARGVQVVLAPGNHDILPSYSPSRLLWSAIRPGPPSPVIEGVQVRRYLDAALELEPRLTTWDGVPLRAYLQSFDSPWNKLVELWDAARATIVSALGLPADTSHWRAFGKHRNAQPAQHAELEANFIAAAKLLYPQIDVAYWQHTLYVVSPESLAEFFEHDPWHNKWYEPYPLRVAAQSPQRDVEILIVNSSPRDPLFAQSSLGRTGAEQIERLGILLDHSASRIVLVLHHHSFVRWKGEEFQFQRWGILSHDPDESNKIVEMLKSKASDGRDIIVMTGHTHGASRSGFLPTKEDASYGVWYFESAALGERPGRSVLAGVLHSTRRFQGGLLRI